MDQKLLMKNMVITPAMTQIKPLHILAKKYFFMDRPEFLIKLSVWATLDNPPKEVKQSIKINFIFSGIGFFAIT